MKNLQTYKLRAECIRDIIMFVQAAGSKIVVGDIDSLGAPDTELTFESGLTATQIRGILRSIEDGHVMLQTIMRIEKYTGERDYALR